MDRPSPPPLAPVQPQADALAGESSESKRARIAAIVSDKGADTALLTAPDSIAWLLNVRGGDVPRTPFPLGFALLHGDGHVDLFMDRRKMPARTLAWLGNAVTLAPPDELGPALDLLGKVGKRVLIESATAPVWATSRLQAAGVTIVRDADPVALPKACKNGVELEGIRNAHRRDGAAVSRFLAWLARESSGRVLREIEVSDRLQAMREQTGKLRDLSFDTISGAGPNGAIVHYHATPETERRLEPGSLYLVDSGGQYRDGTTDITRTVAIGTPTAEMRDRFTRVLKGHIALAMARFPRGHHGLAARRAGALRALAGRARLRPRHGSRRRRLSVGARRAAPHLQDAQQRRAAARHDRQQRARLLQGRRLRHPNREPGGGVRGGGSRAPTAATWRSRR